MADEGEVRDDPSRLAAGVVTHCATETLKTQFSLGKTKSIIEQTPVLIYCVTNLLRVGSSFGSHRFAPLAKREGNKWRWVHCFSILIYSVASRGYLESPITPVMRPGDKMCNFYPCGPTSCVLGAGWGVDAHSGSSHILTRCPGPRLEPNAVRFLLSFPGDRCAGMKMIHPAGGCFAATFSSGFLRSPPQSSFLFEHNITLLVGTFTLSQHCHYF